MFLSSRLPHNDPLTLAKQYLAKSAIEENFSVKRTSHGSSKQIYQVDAGDQSYFLKLAPLDTVGQKHENSKRALTALRKCGIKAPEYLAGEIDLENQQSWFLQSGIAGEDLLTKFKNFQLCPNQIFEQLAQATALLHLQTGLALNPAYSQGVIAASLDREQERYLRFTQTAQYGQELHSVARTIESAFDQVRTIDFFCLNHGDIKPDNCIDHLGEPVLVDWDAAKLGIPEFDLGVFCLLHRNSPGAINYFLNSYQESNDIDPQALQSSIILKALRQYLILSGGNEPNQRLPFLEIISKQGRLDIDII